MTFIYNKGWLVIINIKSFTCLVSKFGMKNSYDILALFKSSGKSIGAGLVTIGRVSVRATRTGVGIVVGIARRLRVITSVVLFSLCDKVSLFYARVLILSLRPFWHVVFSILLILGIRSCFFVSMVVYAEEIIIENRCVRVIYGDNNDSVIVTEYDKRYRDGRISHVRKTEPVFRFSEADFHNYSGHLENVKYDRIQRDCRWTPYFNSQSHRAITGAYPYPYPYRYPYPPLPYGYPDDSRAVVTLPLSGALSPVSIAASQEVAMVSDIPQVS